MNDKISPDVEDHTDEQEDFDPLAELARIVAGEIEDADKEHQTNDSIKPSEEDLVSDDLEAELMREMQEASPEPSQAQSVVDEQLSDSESLSAEIENINEINAALEATDHSAVGANLENASEGDFQNDLIDALQSELGEQDQPEVATETEVATAPIAAIDEAAFEESLNAEIAEPITITEKAEEIEAFSLEEEMAQIVEEGTKAPQSITQTAGIDSEEDLGKAFLDELESRVGISPMPEETPVQAIEASVDPTVDPVAPQAPQFSIDQAIDPVVPDEPQLEPVAPEATQLDPVVSEEPKLGDEMEANDELELDFEQAFSHELGLGASLDDEMVEAPALDAALENEIKTTNTDEFNLDPGHSGQIPEVAPVKAESQVSGMKYAVIAIAVALFAGAGVAAYGFFGNSSSLLSSDIPLIEADKAAYKVKPKDPGGKVVNNQDNATYAEVEGLDNENGSQKDLVSNLEEPAVLDQSKLDKDPKDTDRLTNTEQTEKAGATQNAVVKPRVVKIQTVKADGTIIAASPTSSTTNKVEEQLKLASNQAKELATGVKTVTTKVIAPLKPLDGAKTSNQIVSPTASPKEKPVLKPKKVEVTKVAIPKKKPAAATQVAKVIQPAAQPEPKPVVTQPASNSPASQWVVQVSSSPSQQEAQSSYNQMARKYPVIQGRSTNIVSAQVNGRTYYRLRLNTNSKSDATNLCSQLKSSGGDCFITR